MHMSAVDRHYFFFRGDYWFGEIDSRPLSLFRICFAILLVKDALYHIPLAKLFYSDQGIVPRSVLADVWRTNHRFSLMDAMPSAWMGQVFFILWVGIAFCLLLGYQTRLMTILNFIFVLSIHERNPFVLNGADTLIRNLSFWIMFAPLGQYYSLDAVRRRWRNAAISQNPDDLRPSEIPHTTFAFPVRMIQLQIGLVYLLTYILKLPEGYWLRGESLHMALQLTNFLLPPGEWLLILAPEWLLVFLTRLVLLIEGAFFPLVFLPVLQPHARIVGLVGGVLLHISIAVMMAVPNFSHLMITTYIVFLHPEWIIRAEQYLHAKRQNLDLPLPARHSPLWLLMSLTTRNTITLNTTASNDAATFDTWFVTNAQGITYRGEAAWQQIGAHLVFSRLWLGILKFQRVRRLLWTTAEHWIVRQPSINWNPNLSLPIPSTSPTSTRRWNILRHLVLVMILLPLMLLVIQWNLHDAKNPRGEPIMDRVEGRARAAILLTGLHQGWGMFSPYPSTINGWIRIPGQFEDDVIINLLNNDTVNDEMIFWRFGPYGRMRKYHENLRQERNTPLLDAYARYYCALYNVQQERGEGQRLATLEIHFMNRSFVGYGMPPNTYTEQLLWKHWCFTQYQY